MSDPSKTLFEWLQQANESIDDIAWDDATSVFADQLLLMRPSMVKAIFEEPTEEQVRWAAERIAEAYIALIKDIPVYVKALLDITEDPDMEPSYRAAIIGALAYLVQPRDLIPDDLPGGFGLLDDCLLIHVTACESIAYLPKDLTTTKREELLVNFLALAVPEQRMDEFRATAEGIRHLIFQLGLLDPGEVEEKTAAMIADPMGSVPDTDPEPFRASSAPGGPDYFAPLTGGCSWTAEGVISFAFDLGTVSIFGADVTVSDN